MAEVYISAPTIIQIISSLVSHIWTLSFREREDITIGYKKTQTKTTKKERRRSPNAEFTRRSVS